MSAVRRAPWWRLFNDAWWMLEFERSRAPSAGVALRAWLQGLKARIARCSKLGLGPYRELLAAETDCRDVGLVFAHEDAGQVAPWHLPARFVGLPVESMPAHALLDPHALAAWVRTTVLARDALSLIDAVTRLGDPFGRWQAFVPAGPEADFAGTPLPAPVPPPSKIAVVLHLYYPELWPELWAQLQALPEPFDLFVTVPSFADAARFEPVRRSMPTARFLLSVNRGRDVLPWLRLLRSGVLDSYELVLKLHGKRSLHIPDGDAWRRDSWGALIGDRDHAAQVLARLRAEPRTGLSGPRAMLVEPGDKAWGSKNDEHLAMLLQRWSTDVVAGHWPFFAGTMFWFRPAAMAPLLGLALEDEDFSPEMAQTDGTLAHAIERAIALAVQRAGFGLDALGGRHG